MLNSFRKIGDNLAFKIVLLLIVISFLAWGVNNAMQGNYNPDLVKFSKAENITRQEFIRAYQTHKADLAAQELSQEQLNVFKTQVLRKLINQKLIKSLTKIYDLHLSDKAFLSLLESIPELLDEKGKINTKKLKKLAANNKMPQEEFLNIIKQNLLEQMILKNTIYNYPIPKILTDFLIKHEAKIYELELISLDLTSRNFISEPELKDEELSKFYDNYREKFAIPEKRDFDYAYISKKDLNKNIEITVEEINQYKEENSAELENIASKNLDNVIKAKIAEAKLAESFVTLSNNIEDEIAGGMSLKEIAQKFNLSFSSVKETTLENLGTNNQIYSNYKDAIFQAELDDISSPIETLNGEGMLLFEVKAISKSFVPQFKDVYEKVKQAWLIEFYAKGNLEFLQKLDFTKVVELKKQKNGFTHYPSYKAQKSDKLLPKHMQTHIKELKEGEVTPVFIGDEGTKLYKGLVKKISYDQNVLQNSKDIEENINNLTTEELLEELLQYLYKENNVKINFDDPVFTNLDK